MYVDKHSDLYPEDLTNIADIMRVMPAKKRSRVRITIRIIQKKLIHQRKRLWMSRPSGRRAEEVTNSDSDEVPSHIKYHCCGDNHYVGKCPKKNDISRKNWFDKKEKASSCAQKITEKGEEVLGVSSLQIVHTRKGPEEIIHSGSMIDLFKDNEVVNNIHEAKMRLVMETNAGKS